MKDSVLTAIRNLRGRFIELDLSLSFLFSKNNRLQTGTYLAFWGLVVSVAILVAAMSVMSGFEKTLKEVMIDVTGHVQVVKRGRIDEDWIDFASRLQKISPEIQHSMRFLFTQAVAASKGKILGIILQGVDSKELNSTLNLRRRVISGNLKNCDVGANEEANEEEMCGFVGMGLAKRFGVQAGDEMNIVVPISDQFDPQKFQRRRARFKIGAVIDFGKNDYNERMVLADLGQTQKIAAVGDRYTGLILKLNTAETRPLTSQMQAELGYGYIVRDWREANENLFEAVNIEKTIIFFVITILVIVSAFNISSALYVMTVQRYADISLLKFLGLSQRSVLLIFQFFGVTISLLGSVLGVLFGVGLGFLFEFLQNNFQLLSGEVYKIDHIYVNVRLLDVLLVLVWANLICFIAVLFPARRGARLSVIEGMKHGA